MGKNYSTNQKMELRNENDLYQTPYSLTELLLKKHYFSLSDSFYDPACGKGAILKVLDKYNHNSFGTDLTDGLDFLKLNKNDINTNWIITNPPFRLFNQFVLKALEIARKGVIMFGKLDFVSGKVRYDSIYSQWPPTIIYAFTRKTMLEAVIREDGKFRTGIDAMCWYLWDFSVIGSTVLHWIDNDEFVLRDRKR